MSAVCGCHSACGCDPLRPATPQVHNLPRHPALTWRTSPHADALSRMRAALVAADTPPALPYDGDEATVALLDAWAYVTDVVSFYTERIANEGFLRTATELRSVRELARTLGHELRPGVAATVDLAFTVEDTPDAPEAVDVPAGLPVQSVPAAGQLPQTFETSVDLRARACWNSVPLVPTLPQRLGPDTTEIWVRGTGTGVSPGANVLIVGRERLKSSADKHWDFRVVESVTENPENHPGWTLLHLGARPADAAGVSMPAEEVEVFTFEERASLFGWNAPDPALLCTGTKGPPGSKDCGTEKTVTWDDYSAVSAPNPAPAPAPNPNPSASPTTTSATPDPVIELDGDHPRLTAGAAQPAADAVQPVAEVSWLVLDARGCQALCRVVTVQPDGAARYALSGRITRVQLDTSADFPTFDRRTTVVHCVSRRLDARNAPSLEPVDGRQLDLPLTDPPLPPGRTVLVTGHPGSAAAAGGPSAATGGPQTPMLCERAVVVSCEPQKAQGNDKPTTMAVTLDRELVAPFDPGGLRVLANVVTATHGESVTEVLGSGDGRVPFPTFHPRRAPLTHVRATNATGVRAALELRVDGVVWAQAPSLATAAATDRVHVLRADEDGAVHVILGDGAHGARPPTGVENITTTYRVGIGAQGAILAGQLTLLTRRPLGIRSVVNPAATQDWAPPEGKTEARRNAPQHVRTLDRAVSVTDHEDFAAAFAGVGPARADAVWEGTSTVIVVTVLDTGGATPSTGLLADLRVALEQARDSATRLEVMAGEILKFGLSVDLRHDPAYERAAVEEGVRAALKAAYAPAARRFAECVTAAETLVTIRRTPGVLACTMPRIWLLAAGPAAQAPVLTASTAGWEPKPPAPVPAQLLALAADGITIGEMP